MFYFMTHSTQFICDYITSDIIKDHSDNKTGNPPTPFPGLLFRLAGKVGFYEHHPIDRIVHTMVFVTPVVEYWLQQETAQWGHHEGSIPLTQRVSSLLVISELLKRS